MTECHLVNIAEASARIGLAAARVRFYVETYCDFLGVERDPDGDWGLTADQMHFIAILAAGGTIAEAMGVLPSMAGSAAHGRPEVGPGTGEGSPTISEMLSMDQPGLKRSRVAAGQVSECAVHRPTVDRSSVDGTTLTDRVDELAIHLEDLSEETKQVQILLSRIISLLDGSARPLPASVRPWEPPELLGERDPADVGLFPVDPESAAAASKPTSFRIDAVDGEA